MSSVFFRTTPGRGSFSDSLPSHRKDKDLMIVSGNQIKGMMRLTCLWEAYACMMHERCPQIQPEGLEWLRLNLRALEYKPFPPHIWYDAIQLKEGRLELSLGSERKTAALHKLDNDIHLWGLAGLTDAALEITIQTQEEREMMCLRKQSFGEAAVLMDETTLIWRNRY